MQGRLDDSDRRILYYPRVDARNTTAPMIAEEVDVSAATSKATFVSRSNPGNYQHQLNLEDSSPGAEVFTKFSHAVRCFKC